MEPLSRPYSVPTGYVPKDDNYDPPKADPYPLLAPTKHITGQAVVLTDGGTKHDAGKPDLSLLPPEALIEIAKVLDFGAKKYAPHNWRKGFKWGRVFGATLRHLYAWLKGENLDPETGLSHLAHAGCNVLFLLTFVLTKTGEDDRFVPGATQ